MTKEELERIKQAYYSGLKIQIWFNGHWENFDARDYSMHSDPFSENRLYRIVGSAYTDIAEKRIAELEKENEKLKKRLSVLLSCKNCPDNKGGFICQKEYEDKCLTQKIQYIKELQEENAELSKKIEILKKSYRKQRNKRIDELQKENAELKRLKRECETSLCRAEYQYNYEQLTKAKEIIRMVIDSYYRKERFSFEKDLIKAEQFLNSEVEK